MSKAALEMLALTYAAECETTNVKVNLLNPGPDAHRDARQGDAGRRPRRLCRRRKRWRRKIVEMLSPAYDRSETVVNFRNNRQPSLSTG